MKRILSIVICIAMLITLLPAMSVFAAEYIGDPVVWKSVEKVSVKAGETIDATLVYDTGFKYISGFGIAVNYDPNYLEPVSITHGSDTKGLANLAYAPGVAYANFYSAVAVKMNSGYVIATFTFKVKDTVTDYAETQITYSIDQTNVIYETEYPEISGDLTYDGVNYPVTASDTEVIINEAKKPVEEATQTAKFELTDEFKAILTSSGIEKYSNITLASNPGKTTLKKTGIRSYDELGYDKARTYDVTYKADGTTETTETAVKYNRLREIVDNKANTDVSAKAVGWDYTYSQHEVNVGEQFFSDAPHHNFGLTGSAWDDAQHVLYTREYASGRAVAASFTDGIIGNNTAGLGAKFLTDGTNYTFNVIPDDDCTVYMLFEQSASTAFDTLTADGWTNFKYSDVPYPTEAKIAALNFPGNSWLALDAAYNYEAYPYIMTKMQYDGGSSTMSQNYFNIWYKEVKRNDVVKIPAFGCEAINQNAPKLMIKWGSHLSDDVSGKLTVGTKTINLTSRVNDTIEVSGVNVNDAVSISAASGSDVALSASKVEEIPSVVTATITAPAGNSVTYTIKLTAKRPEITNVNYVSDSFRSELVYTRVEAAKWEAGNNIGGGKQYTAAQYDELEAKYGTIENKKGTDAYAGYPWKGTYATGGTVFVDSPAIISEGSTSSIFFENDSYVFKHNKTRTNSSPYYYGGVGKYDGTDGNYYLTFDIDAPGTMYIFDTEGKGAPNAASMGYTPTTEYKFASGTKAYAKHFNAGETVKVPSYGWDAAWGYDTGARTWYNPSKFVFVFDGDRNMQIEKINYSGAASGTFEKTSTGTQIDIPLFGDVTGEITLDVVLKSETALVTPATVKVNVENSFGSAVFTVVSGDKLATTDYTVTFSKVEGKKIINAGSESIGWVEGIYPSDPAANIGNYYGAVDNAVSGTTLRYSDRSDKLSGANINGSTYIRVPKNPATPGYSDITIDENSGYYKIGADGEWKPVYSSGISRNGSTATKVRKVTTSSYSRPYFAGTYDGSVDGKYWISFTVTSDCTVVVGDRIGFGFPNLDKSEWSNNTKYALDANIANTYVKHFRAGDVVKIPNYGMSEQMKDTTTVYYKYTVGGVEQTFEVRAVDDVCNWENVVYAIIWDEDNADAELGKLSIDGKDIAIEADKTDYTCIIPYGKTSVTVEAAARDPYASVEAPASIAAGETKQIVVTAVNGTTKTISIKAEYETKPVNISVLGGSAVMTVGASSENIGSGYTGEQVYGSVVTLKAIADAGSVFTYWKETETGRIVSTDAEFSFTVTSASSYQAVCATADNGYLITFENANGKVVGQGYSKDDTFVVPENPYMLGYVFNSWVKDGIITSLKAGDALTDTTENTVYKAYFTKSDTEYDLTVTIDGASQPVVKKKYNDVVSYEGGYPAEIGTKVFAYIEKNGVIVSYDRNYEFYMPNYNVELNVVYADTAAEVKSTVVMAAPVLVDGTKISFFMERNIASGNTVLESGILLSSTSTEITLDSYELRGVARQTTNCGQYTVRKGGVATGDTWNAVAYVTYKTAEGEIVTIYSGAVTYTVE